MTPCDVCGQPVGSLEAHHVEVTIQPEGKDATITVHPDCCPADAEFPCDVFFEHTATIDH